MLLNFFKTILILSVLWVSIPGVDIIIQQKDIYTTKTISSGYLFKKIMEK